MKLTILSQYFYPELISTGQVLTEIAEGLTAKGFQIRVICAQPSYYNSNKVDKVMDYNGIHIERVLSTQLNKNSFVGKILNAISFFVAVFGKVLFDPDRAPLLIVTNPPFLPFLGYLLFKINKRRYNILIQDVYPDILYRLNYLKRSSVIVKIWDWLNKKIYHRADKVIVNSRDQKELFVDKGVPERKLVVIENSADVTLIKPISKKDNPFVDQYNLEDKFVVMYSGNMGLFHDMESIAEAAELLKSYSDIVFVFIGGGGKLKRIKEFVVSHNLQNVLFLPYQDKANIRYTLTAADVALIALEKDMEGISVPCKLYGIMAAGVPTVANVPERSEVAYVLAEANCGKWVPVKNASAISEAILFYYNNREVAKEHGRRARKEFESKYVIEHAITKYMNTLNGI